MSGVVPSNLNYAHLSFAYKELSYARACREEITGMRIDIPSENKHFIAAVDENNDLHHEQALKLRQVRFHLFPTGENLEVQRCSLEAIRSIQVTPVYRSDENDGFFKRFLRSRSALTFRDQDVSNLAPCTHYKIVIENNFSYALKAEESLSISISEIGQVEDYYSLEMLKYLLKKNTRDEIQLWRKRVSLEQLERLVEDAEKLPEGELKTELMRELQFTMIRKQSSHAKSLLNEKKPYEAYAYFSRFKNNDWSFYQDTMEEIVRSLLMFHLDIEKAEEAISKCSKKIDSFTTDCLSDAKKIIKTIEEDGSWIHKCWLGDDKEAIANYCLRNGKLKELELFIEDFPNQLRREFTQKLQEAKSHLPRMTYEQIRDAFAKALGGSSDEEVSRMLEAGILEEKLENSELSSFLNEAVKECTLNELIAFQKQAKQPDGLSREKNHLGEIIYHALRIPIIMKNQLDQLKELGDRFREGGMPLMAYGLNARETFRQTQEQLQRLNLR